MKETRSSLWRQLARCRTGCPLALGALLALTACAVGPRYKRPSVPTQPAFKEDQSWKPATPAQIPDDMIWWSIYADPTLDGLERQVAVSNQNLKAAEAAYRSAQAEIGIDRGSLLPDITATGSKTRSGGSSGFGQAVSTASGTTITSGGGRRTVYSAAAQGTSTLLGA